MNEIESFKYGLNKIRNGKEENKVPISWTDYVINEEPPDELPINKIGFAPIATAGNHSLIIGKKKSRKSLFLVLWLDLYLKVNPGYDLSEVLIFDTEQGKRHVWKVMDRIQRMTGHKVTILYLRGKSPAERKQIIEEAIKDNRPKVVFIDGIRDLISNINDPDQSTDLITWIERITLEFGVHIVNVLHQNKTNNDARGHIGSELLNKAEITIDLERDEKAECTIVKCESSRDIPFDPFAFTHNDQGLPEMVAMPNSSGKALPEFEQKERLKFIFKDGGDLLAYGDLCEGVKVHFNVGMNRAKNMIAEFNRNGWIIKNGNDKNKTIYKSMI